MISGWYKSGRELIREIKETRMPEDILAVWFFGQAGICVKSEERVFCIDPYLTDRPGARRFDPPFSLLEADFFDVVLCTHNHLDHLDPETLRGIAAANEAAKIIVPCPFVSIAAECGFKEENIIGAIAGEAISVKNVRILPVPAAHENFDYDADGHLTALGYVLYFPGASLYHSGDTVEWESMVEDLKPLQIDIACLPINGSDWKRKHQDIIGNLNSREAANVAEGIGADLLIPMHYDLFAHNGENPAHLSDYMFTEHPGRKYHFMAPGERFLYSKH